MKLLIAFAALLLLSASLSFAMFDTPLIMSVAGTSPPPVGNVSCDYGPNTTFPTGQIGADLTSAKYTHCVLNLDFTDNSGTATGGGYVMNNLATYVNECAGTSSTTAFRLYFRVRNANGSNGDNGGAPCARLSIVNDPADGKRSLSVTVSASDLNTGVSPNVDGLFLSWPLCGDLCQNFPNTGLALPTAKYVEFTYRINSNTETGNFTYMSIEDGPFSSSAGNGAAGWALDEVWIEASTNGQITATSWDNYTANSAAFPCASPPCKGTVGFFQFLTETTLHTRSVLMTGNGGTGQNASTLDICVWQDGTLIVPLGPTGTPHPGGNLTNCATQSLFTANELVSHNDHPGMAIGYMTAPPLVPANFNNPITVYLRQIRVFTCATWSGTGNNCTTDQTGGSLVFHTA